MAIEIGPGWTIGGGISIVQPPSGPPTSTAGWWSAGFDFGPVSATAAVNRITYATDTASASSRGPLSVARYWLTGTGTTTYGWYSSGQTPSGRTTVMDRITYTTDTATATARTTMGYPSPSSSTVRDGLASSTDYTTYGWFGGGYYPGTGSPVSVVQRLDYATDTAGLTTKGPLSVSTYYMVATSNLNNGWFAGGTPGPFSTVSRITYATDTATATTKGPLAAATYRFAATGNGNYGWFAGGPGLGSNVNRIDYANDTSTASIRGPLSSSRSGFAGAGDGNNYGWYANAPSNKSDRIDYANDTTTASLRGTLTGNKYMGATAGIQ